MDAVPSSLPPSRTNPSAAASAAGVSLPPPSPLALTGTGAPPPRAGRASYVPLLPDGRDKGGAEEKHGRGRARTGPGFTLLIRRDGQRGQDAAALGQAPRALALRRTKAEGTNASGSVGPRLPVWTRGASGRFVRRHAIPLRDGPRPSPPMGANGRAATGLEADPRIESRCTYGVVRVPYRTVRDRTHPHRASTLTKERARARESIDPEQICTVQICPVP